MDKGSGKLAFNYTKTFFTSEYGICTCSIEWLTRASTIQDSTKRCTRAKIVHTVCSTKGFTRASTEYVALWDLYLQIQYMHMKQYGVYRSEYGTSM